MSEKCNGDTDLINYLTGEENKSVAKDKNGRIAIGYSALESNTHNECVAVGFYAVPEKRNEALSFFEYVPNPEFGLRWGLGCGFEGSKNKNKNPDATLHVVGDSKTIAAHFISGKNQPAVHTEGGQKWKVVKFSTPDDEPVYTADLTDHVIIYNGNSIKSPTVHLPHPVGLDGQVYIIKNAGFDGLTMKILASSSGKFYDNFEPNEVAEIILSSPGTRPDTHNGAFSEKLNGVPIRYVVTVIASGGFYHVISQ